MVTHYLDTSVAVHALVGDPRAATWFADMTAGERPVASSRILQTELTRVLRRESVDVARRRHVTDYLTTIGLTEIILTSAEAIAGQVRALVAIHLASALALGSDTVVVTHDHAMARVARELGLTAMDPMAATSE